jgi:hypothetical protein
LNEFNKLQPTIKFTTKKELHESINFLDLTIHREEKKLLFSIYRKPTQAEIIIPKDSCHPHEHNSSSINYLLNRVHSYPTTKEAKEIELNTIRGILLNNQYNINESIKRPKPKQRNAHTDTQEQKTKWATFTYSGKEVRKITKLFRDTQIKIAFRTKNTIQNILKPQPHIDKYSRSGIYQIKCLDCPLKYIGQMGRTFNIRYKEHVQAIKKKTPWLWPASELYRPSDRRLLAK